MPTFNYAGMQATALNLLTKFGTDVTITYTTSETYTVATQTNAKVTSTFTGIGVVVPFDKTEIDGQTIEQNDLKLIMNNTSRAPAIDNVVTWESIDYRIMEVELKAPGGDNIVYVCRLRL